MFLETSKHYHIVGANKTVTHHIILVPIIEPDAAMHLRVMGTIFSKSLQGVEAFLSRTYTSCPKTRVYHLAMAMRDGYSRNMLYPEKCRTVTH